MVQVIEQQGLGDLLGRGLGQGVSQGLQTLLQAKIKGMQEQQSLENLSKLFGSSPQSGSPATEETEEFVSYTPGQLIAAEKQIPGSSKILLEKEKQAKEKYEKAEDRKKLDATLKNMLKVVPKIGPGKIGNVFTEEGRAARQYYNSLAMKLEQIGSTMVGKGTLSKPRFDFLLKNLPSSSKTQAANYGALKAWSETLGVPLDIPELEGVLDTEQKESPKKEMKKLDKEKAMEFLKKTKGDKEKARKLAKKYGYEF